VSEIISLIHRQVPGAANFIIHHQDGVPKTLSYTIANIETNSEEPMVRTRSSGEYLNTKKLINQISQYYLHNLLMEVKRNNEYYEKKLFWKQLKTGKKSFTRQNKPGGKLKRGPVNSKSKRVYWQ
jgi:hypothetical protein